MKNLALRLTLVVLTVAGFAGAGYFLFTAESQIRSLQAGTATIDRETARVRAVVAEIRASQSGYFVAGQDRAFWISKVAALIKDAQAGTTALAQANLRTADTGEDLATAAEALGSFARFDTRVRALLDDGQPLTAATLAFSDAWQLLGAADKSLGQVQRLQAEAAGRKADLLRQRQAWALAGSAGLALVVLLLLAPRSTRHKESDETPLARGDSPAGELKLNAGDGPDWASAATLSSSRGLALQGDPDIGDGIVSRARKVPSSESTAKTGVSSPPVSSIPANPPSSSSAAGPAGATTAGPNASALLAQAATLCSDLAKVESGNELEQILERAAALLDASGIVLWMGGSEGDTPLQPALSWGYAPGVLAKMRALPRDSENAVSSAVRSCRVEVVPAGSKGNGAIVVPLQSAGGCRGAMAVETRNRGESSEVVRSLAAIVAAQVSAFLPEPSA